MYTIESNVIYEEHLHKSHFIGNILRVSSPEEAKAQISSIAAKYRDATHNCWAYRTGLKGEFAHSSDAGEPSGTAGKPILNALQRSELANVALIVTRYFGGIKFGIRGLIEAYRHIAEETINKAQLNEIILKDFWEIITDYAQAERLKYALQELRAEIQQVDYRTMVTIHVSSVIESGLEEYLRNSQDAGLLKYSLLKTEL